MINQIIEIIPNEAYKELPNEKLSLKPFVEYIRNVYEKSNRQKQRFLSFVVKRIEYRLGADMTIDPAKASDYADLWNLVYVCTNPILDDERDHQWALSMPVSPVFIYCTNALFQIIYNKSTGLRKKNLAEAEFLQAHNDHAERCYSMILRRLYDVDTVFRKELIFPFEEEATNITRYFRVVFDDRYLDLQFPGELPEVCFDIKDYTKDQLLKLLKERLPLQMFTYEGICVIHVTEVTAHYAVENIKQTLLSEKGQNPADYHLQVSKSLQSLARSNEVEFGLFPLIKMNNKHIFSRQTSVNSQLIKMFEQQGWEKEDYYFFGENYLNEPRPVLFKDIPEVTDDDKLCLNVLTGSNIYSYALLPVFFNNKLCGILEVYCRKADVLNEEMLARLEPAIPFVAQIFQRNIDEFEKEIDKVIKQHFTSVQPSVQWKFNDVAWHYIRDQHLNGTRNAEIGNIAFDKVFPLYGAVDIRNSTIERNEASRIDLLQEVTVLVDVLEQLKKQSGFGLIEEKIFQCNKWLEKLREPEHYAGDNRINEYLEFEVQPFLRDFKAGNPLFASIIERYFKVIDPVTGPAYEQRRQLELSMNQVIGAVNNYMELMKEEMQAAYPCYFEKFRTDGVEYDVYIGQSLSPDRPFSEIYLGNLRLMQLTSMAAIARYTHALQKELKKPVETTQLIFIHSHAIDILFRKDEKRFDVEGAYNIRYHIVKKRIDKVHIKGSKERLTLPRKIALVYLTQKEADEYVSYIRYLVEKGVLVDDLEYLELEQLQGISGLKAMRVGVALPG